MTRADLVWASAFTMLTVATCVPVQPLRNSICRGRIGVQIAEDAPTELRLAVAMVSRYWNDRIGSPVFYPDEAGQLFVEIHDTVGTTAVNVIPIRPDRCIAAVIVTVSREVPHDTSAYQQALRPWFREILEGTVQ